MEEQTTTATRTRPQVQKPRLEIPDPIKLAGSASSPRSMHGFPQSPQSPYSVSPAASGDVKSFEEWSSSVAAVTNCQDDSSSSSSSAAAAAAAGSDGVEKKRLLHFYVGELVLVRCNQSKWLLGQVRRSSKTGVIVWVGVAQTLVNVPYDLLASHLVKLDSPRPASPSSTVSAGALEVSRSGQLMAPFQCVRPAHLSHRKLYQTLQPAERGRNKAHHPNSVQTGMPTNQQSGREIFLSSSSLPSYSPGNLEIIQGFKTETNQARTSVRRSYALCRFKFPEQQENEDDSFMNRFGRATELYPAGKATRATVGTDNSHREWLGHQKKC